MKWLAYRGQYELHAPVSRTYRLRLIPELVRQGLMRTRGSPRIRFGSRAASLLSLTIAGMRIAPANATSQTSACTGPVVAVEGLLGSTWGPAMDEVLTRIRHTENF